eukprot:COSAG06_NODE_3_length_43832_cov_136.908399_28_plen_389_part_00
MPRLREARWPTLVTILAAVVACCTGFTAAIPTTASGGLTDAAASTLFACGSNGDAFADTNQMLHLFEVVKTICCDQLNEQCDDKNSLVPATCHTAGCARIVDLVEQSCAAAFADGFLGVAFKPQFDPLVNTCRTAEMDPTPTYVISDPGLQAVVTTTTCHGRVIDGATSGFLTSGTGQDAIVLQAPEGMQLQVAGEMMYLPPTANVRFYDGATVDDPELGLLRGTSLDDRGDPPQRDGGSRTFVSSKGKLRVMRVVDRGDAGLPLVFSLRIDCVCTDGAEGCGAHGSCVNGLCKCDEGYGGGMCETILDHCKFPVEVDCGAHGSCVDGSCDCNDRYTGSTCTQAPTPCCSSCDECCGSGGYACFGRYCNSYCCTCGYDSSGGDCDDTC